MPCSRPAGLCRRRSSGRLRDRRAAPHVNLFRGELGRPLVIGHRGAAALAAENTLASLEAAIAAGRTSSSSTSRPVSRLGTRSSELPRDELSLDEALEFLGGHDVGLHLDVKLPGYEDGVLDALRRHRLEDRAYLSTAFAVTGAADRGQGARLHDRDRLST